MSQLDEYRNLNPILKSLPKQPHAKQLEFLSIKAEEVLFGGAAGCGKTESLLMWLAEGVGIKGYNAAIFRKFQTDTKDDESALIAKAAQLYPAIGGKLTGFRWTFPAGSSIIMEGVAHEHALLSKQGKEYHRVAFDELTHFTEQAYDFVTLTRVRKVKGFPVRCGSRASANPGGPGHIWVKERFIPDKAIKEIRNLEVSEPTPYGMVYWSGPDVCYVPARAADNPSLDVADYLKRMRRNRNPVMLARMMNGDWGIAPEGLIKDHWLRYYTMRDRMIDLLVSLRAPDGGILHTDQVLKSFHEQECRRFMTVDTAGGMDQITAESKGKPASWTVVGVWDSRFINNLPVLILRHLWRDRVGFTDVGRKLMSLCSEWHPHRVRVEDKTMGPDLYNMLKGKIPIDLIPTGTKDKVTRAAPLMNMLEEGRVYLPKWENSWRIILETEWLGWQGLKEETNDIVDMSAYAAIEAGKYGSGMIEVDMDIRKALPVSHKPW